MYDKIFFSQYTKKIHGSHESNKKQNLIFGYCFTHICQYCYNFTAKNVVELIGFRYILLAFLVNTKVNFLACQGKSIAVIAQKSNKTTFWALRREIVICNIPKLKSPFY